MTAPTTIGSVEAERAFLGCLLQINGDFLRLIVNEAEADDFTEPRHAAVHTAMLQLHAAKQPLDPVTVLGQLRRSGLVRAMTADREAGVFLTDLIDATPSVGCIGYYLTILLEHRVRRECARIAERMTQVAGHEDLDVLRKVMHDDLPKLGNQWMRLNRRVGAS